MKAWARAAEIARLRAQLPTLANRSGERAYVVRKLRELVNEQLRHEKRMAKIQRRAA